MMQRCWHDDPDQRPEFSQLVRDVQELAKEVRLGGRGGGRTTLAPTWSTVALHPHFSSLADCRGGCWWYRRWRRRGRSRRRTGRRGSSLFSSAQPSLNEENLSVVISFPALRLCFRVSGYNFALMLGFACEQRVNLVCVFRCVGGCVQ